MASIQFFTEAITFSLTNPRKTSRWLGLIAKKEGHAQIDLRYIFCDDEFLSGLNTQYLNHKTLTDIITFDLSGKQRGIEGEVYISIPRVRENALKYKQPLDTEVRRVMVHGLLHLLGFSDKSASQKVKMRQKEDACLSLWK